MMRIAFALTFILFFCTACPKVTKEDGPKLGEMIELRMNEPMTIDSEKLTLTLTGVQEGRCPKDVNCIRAGEAKATIEVMHIDAIQEIVLEAKGLCFEKDGSCGQSKKSQGYLVKMYTISPYPIANDTEKKIHVAKVMVTKG